MAGWSKNTQVELRALLQVLGQPTGGSKAALAQRLTAFMSDDVGDDSERRPVTEMRTRRSRQQVYWPKTLLTPSLHV
jgi:hypothetical protein